MSRVYKAQVNFGYFVSICVCTCLGGGVTPPAYMCVLEARGQCHTTCSTTFHVLLFLILFYFETRSQYVALTVVLNTHKQAANRPTHTSWPCRGAFVPTSLCSALWWPCRGALMLSSLCGALWWSVAFRSLLWEYSRDLGRVCR